MDFSMLRKVDIEGPGARSDGLVVCRDLSVSRPVRSRMAR